MTSEIVLPSLTQWAETHITNIYQSTSKAELASALDAFLSQKAVVTINGARLSLDDYATQLQSEKFDEDKAIIKFIGTVEVPCDPNQPIKAGSVGLLFTANTKETKMTVSTNLLIEQDCDIPTPPNSEPPLRGLVDRRRVTNLSQVEEEQEV